MRRPVGSKALRIDTMPFNQSTQLGAVQAQRTRGPSDVALMAAQRLFDAGQLPWIGRPHCRRSVVVWDKIRHRPKRPQNRAGTVGKMLAFDARR